MADRRKVSRKVVLVAAATVLAVTAAALVFALTRRHVELVRIELRAMPVATIRFHGKNLGTTPKTLHVPRSHQPVPIEATFTVYEVNAMTGQKKTKVYKQTKSVTPDAEQAVDFDIKAATNVSPE